MSERSYYSEDRDVALERESVTQFEIVILNNHNKTYYPSQYVEGHVIVKVEKSFVTRGMFDCLMDVS